MALNAEIAAAASVAAAERASVDLRKQALYDTVFLIGAADGSFSDSERAKLAIGLQGLLGPFNRGLAQLALQGLELRAHSLLALKGALQALQRLAGAQGRQGLSVERRRFDEKGPHGG